MNDFFFLALLASSNVGKMNIICDNGHISTCASIQIIFTTIMFLLVLSIGKRLHIGVGFG
jgi:hypothetical protein